MTKRVMLDDSENLNPPYEINTDNPAVVAIVEMTAKHEVLLTLHNKAVELLKRLEHEEGTAKDLENLFTDITNYLEIEERREQK